jgi:catechol 2,3-dioxygenase-like lactoylglutathione lyase family enzyme
MSLKDAQVRATIAVAEMTAATDFYEGRLGLTPMPDQGGNEAVRMYECGPGSLLQIYVSEHAGSGTATTASWSVEDFEEVVGELRAAGVGFETFDGLTSEDGVHSFGEHKVVWFADPDGNTIAVDNGSNAM